MSTKSRFSEELNKALYLPVKHVCAKLNDSGYPVREHVFSYWLQGYFIPRSEDAFPLVSCLEKILGISDNALSDALAEDLSSGASFVPGENAEPEVLAVPDDHELFSTTVDDLVDWDAALVQKVARDEIVLSADHQYLTRKVTILAQIPSAPDPAFVFQLSFDKGLETGREEVFYNLSGIVLRHLDVVEEGGRTMYSAQFALPDNAVPGDLCRFSFMWDEKFHEPFDGLCYRFVPWVLDYYSASVTFEGKVPDNIRYVTCENCDGEDVEVPNEIPVRRHGQTVSVSVKNFGNIIGYFDVPPPFVA